VARYLTTVRSRWSSPRAFEYLADVRNLVDWDPSVVSVDQVAGDGGGRDTEFDVEVAHAGGSTTFRYRTTRFEPSTTVQIEARTRALTSIDRISFADDGEGCLVTYDARLDLNGSRRVLDPLLRLVFGRVGDRAAAGLESALEGARALR
jgi:hypothetical protein